MLAKRRQLALEALEDRLTPTTSGMPCPYSNVTLSFVPDGTSIDGTQSSLFQTMNSQMATTDWEAQILKAAQTWADAANINVGLVSDDGEAIGCPGLIQGDMRFGDIRIAAEPLGVGAQVAIGSLYNPIAGTRSGDVIFNSSYVFGIGTHYDLYMVALHELGHSFGLIDNTDPTSVMFYTYQGPQTGLSSGDVAAIQSLYGPRAPDAFEGTAGNNTSSTAAVMTAPEIAGDLGTVNESDFYQYTVPSDADQNLTVTVQTGGVSLLVPDLSVFSGSGELLASSSGTDAFDNTTSVALSNIQPGTTLTFELNSTANNVFGMGGYRLKVDSGDVSRLEIAAIDDALNGTDIAYTEFGQTPSTIATAVSLDQPIYQSNPRFNYAMDARLDNSSDVNYVSFTTPATAPQAVVLTAVPGQGSESSPALTVYDGAGNTVSAQTLSNDAGGYVVQVLDPAANATYYVAASFNPADASSNDTGDYRLTVNYTNTPIVMQFSNQGTVSGTDSVHVLHVQSTEVQIYHFVISVNTGVTATGVEVQMDLLDTNGNVVTSLLCQDGEAVSATLLLEQANYTIRITGVNTGGAALPATDYSLLGANVSDNLDPVTINPTDPTLTGSSGSSGSTGGGSTTLDTSTLLVISDPTTTS
jgi:hypothetical protein